MASLICCDPAAGFHAVLNRFEPGPQGLDLIDDPSPLRTDGSHYSLIHSVSFQTIRTHSWATLLARVFRIDVTTCPDCGGPMRIIAALTDPSSIRRWLQAWLGSWYARLLSAWFIVMIVPLFPRVSQVKGSPRSLKGERASPRLSGGFHRCSENQPKAATHPKCDWWPQHVRSAF